MVFYGWFEKKENNNTERPGNLDCVLNSTLQTPEGARSFSFDKICINLYLKQDFGGATHSFLYDFVVFGEFPYKK